MHYHALAFDYDGTLALDGRVDDATLTALERLRESGRRLLLVSGRRLEDLKQVCPRLELFDRIVAEDGALIYRPETQEETSLGTPPPPEFTAELRRRGVDDLACGRVIVATWEPHDHVVLDLIREMGIEYQVIFNKGAVMVLPTGLNKAVGLRRALRELGLSPHNVIGIGDAENDHAFLSICECAVAVANALPALKEHADLVTVADHGEGVVELAGQLLASDLAELSLERHDLVIGQGEAGERLAVPGYGNNLLLAGTSGSGKSTVATAFMEQLAEQEYQYCIIDPEGDYADFSGAVAVGDRDRPPTITELLGLLERGEGSFSANLIGLPLDDRPPFFERFFTALLEFRSRTGRPHWLIIDEAHHLLPASWPSPPLPLPVPLQGLLLITVHPDYVSPQLLTQVHTIIALGESPADTIAAFARIGGHAQPVIPDTQLGQGEAFVWQTQGPVIRSHTLQPRAELRRHLRKYAEGELPEDRSFWFRGPEQRLNIRAQNLRIFLQIADGVDDETWMYHLRSGDYSRWMSEAIKDRKLAEEVACLEQQDRTPAEGRRLLRRIIEEYYTAAA